MQWSGLLQVRQATFTPAPSGVLQRCACGGVAGQAGECAACRQKRDARAGGSDRLSGSLKIAAPDGQAEMEANQTAALIVGRQDAPTPRQPIMAEVQRLPIRGAGTQTAPPVVNEPWRSAGSPLDPATRALLEPRFGHDFSQVRIHAGTEATERAQLVEARAYTLGQDIAFGAGEYAPATRAGQRLLAHELTHVIQQEGHTPLVQRAPADISPQDVPAARRRAARLAQRIRAHTRLSKEVKSSINRDLAFFGGAAKDAYVQVIRPALLAVTEIQMPAQRMTRELPPVRPATSLSLLSADQICGGTCLTDDEIDVPIREREARERDAQQQLRQVQLDRLSDMMKKDDWGAEYQVLALDLLGQVLARNINPDPRGVSDFTRPLLLARYEDFMRAVDAQRMAACAQGGPGLLATIRSRANNDDPCKSWFKDASSHGPRELTDLQRVLGVRRMAHLPAAEKVYYDVFDYRRKVDPVMLEQEQMAGAMVNAGVAVASGINAKVNRPPTRPPGGMPKTPSGPPNLQVIQGGGQTTPLRQGHLTDVDKPPLPPTFRPGTIPSANDNVTIPPLSATGTDPLRPPSNTPQAVRRVVTPDGTTTAPPGKGTVTPATNLPTSEPEPETGDVLTGGKLPYRGKGSRQMAQDHAHDVGVQEGRVAAERDGLVHYFDNPFGIERTTQGQDSVFMNPKTGAPVIVEMKGGKSQLSPGQMGNAEINRQVLALEQRLPGHPVTKLVRGALDNGTLEGRTYSTRIGPTGTPLDTTVQNHGTYRRTP
jgi:Domain of unknown function (DUF4157)